MFIIIMKETTIPLWNPFLFFVTIRLTFNAFTAVSRQRAVALSIRSARFQHQTVVFKRAACFSTEALRASASEVIDEVRAGCPVQTGVWVTVVDILFAVSSGESL